MNPLTQVKNTQKVTRQELLSGVSESASWHASFKHSAYVFAGGLDFQLTEGDLLAVFAQYGEVVDVNLARDKDTGRSRGFAFLAYEARCRCDPPQTLRDGGERLGGGRRAAEERQAAAAAAAPSAAPAATRSAASARLTHADCCARRRPLRLFTCPGRALCTLCPPAEPPSSRCCC
jgi:RNA-binding motif X-linked protein 2